MDKIDDEILELVKKLNPQAQIVMENMLRILGNTCNACNELRAYNKSLVEFIKNRVEHDGVCRVNHTPHIDSSGMMHYSKCTCGLDDLIAEAEEAVK